uniref:Uncharacterized protein n=1 Tax=Oryza punctata TaxID=4537 RepID=A0A0E0M2B8_ORYPU
MRVAVDLAVVRHGDRRPRGSDGGRPPPAWRRRIGRWGGAATADPAVGRHEGGGSSSGDGDGG